MKLLFVADGRSPIALNWIRYFSGRGHSVHMVSLYSCHPDLELDSLEIIPIAFSAGGTSPGRRTMSERRQGNRLEALATPRLRTWIRQAVVPLRLPGAARRLSEITAKLRPDLVHAMRIPYEGMVAALADPAQPLVVSVWGNDFTLHAGSTPLTARYTRRAMDRADALHTDCRRDARLAAEWGFPPGSPQTILPSGGGVQMDLFRPPEVRREEDWPAEAFEVINPRGLRAYVCNDTFFEAVPLVLAGMPGVRFTCPGMAGEPAAERWLQRHGGAEAVRLLPPQGRQEMAELFRRARAAVSLTTHDGTPNTLLEAMACGCYPIAGDLESIREWITPGVNGALVDPRDPREVAGAILGALGDPDRLATAAAHNLRLILEKAEYSRVMSQAEVFYKRLF